MIAAPPAVAQATEPGPPAIDLSVDYTADVAGVLDGGLARRGRVLDNLEAAADIDLGRLAGWSGATAHLVVQNNSGGMPNDDAGTLQGVDNIEVTRQRARLFEAWIQQSFAGDRGSVRAGLYDLNAEFYSSDTASLLLAPAFGIGSEVAATGPNGPSIFPSTALAVRGRWDFGDQGYVEAAVLNANAGVVGDPGGVDTTFDMGELLIAEAAWTGDGKVAVGTWRYTRRQDDWRELDRTGQPIQQVAQGAYILAEHRLTPAARLTRRVSAFARLGLSDGRTTAYRGGWQAGLLVAKVFASRPNSLLSIGVNQAWITPRHRANSADAGRAVGRTESAFELTYSDRVIGPLTLQPDLQYIIRPGGDRGVKNALVATLRLALAF